MFKNIPRTLCQGKTCWLPAHILLQQEVFFQKRKKKKKTKSFWKTLNSSRSESQHRWGILKVSHFPATQVQANYSTTQKSLIDQISAIKHAADAIRYTWALIAAFPASKDEAAESFPLAANVNPRRPLCRSFLYSLCSSLLIKKKWSQSCGCVSLKSPVKQDIEKRHRDKKLCLWSERLLCREAGGERWQNNIINLITIIVISLKSSQVTGSI